jgi:hypothetical protein
VPSSLIEEMTNVPGNGLVLWRTETPGAKPRDSIASIIQLEHNVVYDSRANSSRFVFDAEAKLLSQGALLD